MPDDAFEGLADDGVVLRRRRQRGLVDLDVARASLDELLDLLVDEVGQIVHEFPRWRVRLVERPEPERVGPRDRDLDGMLGDRRGELELVDEPRLVVLDLPRRPRACRSSCDPTPSRGR